MENTISKGYKHLADVGQHLRCPTSFFGNGSAEIGGVGEEQNYGNKKSENGKIPPRCINTTIQLHHNFAPKTSSVVLLIIICFAEFIPL